MSQHDNLLASYFGVKNEKEIAQYLDCGIGKDEDLAVLLTGSILGGHLPAVKLIYATAPHLLHSNHIVWAAIKGNWKVVTFLLALIDDSLQSPDVPPLTALTDGTISGDSVAWPQELKYTASNIDAFPHSFDMISTDKCGCKIVCGLHCANVKASIVCSDDICPIGPRCGNLFEQIIPIELFKTSNGRGIGVRTKVWIPKEMFIIEYVGELISQRQSDVADNKLYMMQIKDTARVKGSRHGQRCNVYIDAADHGNESRFINHSCGEWNCISDEWFDGKRRRVGIFAIRDIQPGEELLFDYNPDGDKSDLPFECHCGSSNCISPG